MSIFEKHKISCIVFNNISFFPYFYRKEYGCRCSFKHWIGWGASRVHASMGEDDACHLSIDHVTNTCNPSPSFITPRCELFAFTVASSSLTAPACLLWFFCPGDGGRMLAVTSAHVGSSPPHFFLWQRLLGNPRTIPSFLVHCICSLPVYLVFTFVCPLSSPPHPHSQLAMPRLRGKPKRGPLWFQNKVAIASRHPPIPAPSPSSSPPSSAQSSPGQSGLPPLSSPWACRVEWFDLHDNSLGYAPGPIQDMASSSQPTLVHS
jgi:hypothetical protein